MSLYICSNCGYGSASWIGRCPDCQQWDTLKKQADGKEKNKTTDKFVITSFANVKPINNIRLKTGIFEFDRVIGGGLAPDEVILFTGEPGIGKSTIILQAFHNLKTLYVSGEESAEQVKERVDRLGIKENKISFSNNQQVESIIEGIKNHRNSFQVIIIDSIQTIYSNSIEGAPGNINQLKETAMKIIDMAKSFKIPVILIGHVTKGGEVAGPKTLEHMVDAVLSFEGEKISHFRILRATKNRFGTTEEIGIFEMTAKGLSQVNNPLAFLEPGNGSSPGMAIVGISEGKRPIFFEIQTLVSPTILAIPRRIVKGVDYNKILLLLAVIKKYLNLPLDKFDVYINVVGGVSVKSPAADLGIAASIISSLKNVPIKQHIVFTGEIGLLGETRKVVFEDKIVSEAQRLGFKQIYSSKNLANIKQLKSKIIP